MNKVQKYTNIIKLTPDEVNQAIVGCFGDGENYLVSANEEVSLSQNQDEYSIVF